MTHPLYTPSPDPVQRAIADEKRRAHEARLKNDFHEANRREETVKRWASS